MKIRGNGIKYLLKKVFFEAFCGFYLFLLFFASLFKKKYGRIRLFYIEYLKDTRSQFMAGDKSENFSRKIGNIFPAFVILFFLCAFFFFLLHYEGPSRGYWDTYITVPSVLMTKTPVEFVGTHGNRMYDYRLENDILKNLFNPSAYGIACKDQRLGAGIVFSLPFLLFGGFGFRFMYALINVLIGALVFITIKKLFDNRILSLLAAGFLLFNPYFLYVDRLNPDSAALLISGAIVLLLLEEGKSWILLGILCGILCGIRNVAILMLPAFLFWFCVSPSKLRNTLKFSLGFFAGLSPILWWNYYAYGTPVIHSSQFSSFHGFRPVFEHSFLGFKFMFNGLLNWPFYGNIIRTPHFPFPTFITIPLVLIRSFGLFLFSLMCVGIFTFFRQNRKLSGFLTIYFLLFMLMLSVQENWEELKMTYLIAVFNIMIIYIVSAVYFFMKTRNKIKFAGLFFLVMAVIVFFVGSMKTREFTPDARWYERFPKAGLNLSGYELLPETERKGWQFFQTRESVQELRIQREKLTSLSFLPRKYIQTGHDYKQAFLSLGTEFGNRNIKIFEIWDWIYSDIGKKDGKKEDITY